MLTGTSPLLVIRGSLFRISLKRSPDQPRSAPPLPGLNSNILTENAGSILAGNFENFVHPAWVFVDEVREIVDLSFHDGPTVVLGVMLLNFLQFDLPGCQFSLARGGFREPW